jgi:hypothetical protein
MEQMLKFLHLNDEKAIEASKLILKYQQSHPLAIHKLIDLFLLMSDEKKCCDIIKFLLKNKSLDSEAINIQIINKLLEFMKRKDSLIRLHTIQILNELTKSEIRELIDYEEKIFSLIESLFFPEEIEKLINFILVNKNDFDPMTGHSIALIFNRVTQLEILNILVANLKDYTADKVQDDDLGVYMFAHEIVWHCAQHMSYPEFYHAWNSPALITSSETPKNLPAGNTSTVQVLEEQIRDLGELLKELQPTQETYPIVINAEPLEDETDNTAIAQELCNQIYQTVFPDDENIPEVNNHPQLKRLIPKLKKQLNTQHIALILYQCEPNSDLISFCRKLTNDLHVAFITTQKIEPPLAGFPDQPNLISILQNWLSEI